MYTGRLAGGGCFASSPTSTASWFRGERVCFPEREEKITDNRIIRKDPSTSSMRNREPLTPARSRQSIKDVDLWPIYIPGLDFQTPISTPANYRALSPQELGFDTLKANLLVIPTKIFPVTTMLALAYAGEEFGELTFTALFGQIWALPCLIHINVVDVHSINHVLTPYTLVGILQLQHGPRSSRLCRTAQHVPPDVRHRRGEHYTEEDAPRDKRGNHLLLSLPILNISLFLGTKLYHVKRDAWREKRGNGTSEDAKLATTTDGATRG
ncbi:unnamed protein product [Diplocarpon coronariae]